MHAATFVIPHTRTPKLNWSARLILVSFGLAREPPLIKPIDHLLNGIESLLFTLVTVLNA
jgi:hypothetical protein